VRLHLKRWTGVSVGWVLSSENGNPGCPWCQTVRRPRGSAQKKRECAADPAESKTPRMQRNRVPSGRARTERPCHCPSAAGQRAGRGTRKGKPFMHGGRESSICIVPTNDPNKLRTLRAEGGEGSGWPRRSDGRGLIWTQRQRNQVHYTANGTGRRVWSATSSSKAGTKCVRSASTGLCGGQWVTAVPTATAGPLDPPSAWGIRPTRRRPRSRGTAQGTAPQLTQLFGYGKTKWHCARVRAPYTY